MFFSKGGEAGGMILPEFDVLVPDSLEQAATLLDQYGPEGAMVMAGGTDLIVRMKEGALRPGKIILLEKIESLKGISSSKKTIRIGALTTFGEIIHSEEIRKKAPLLADACRNIGAPQLWHRGTIGGNIANASPCADAVTALVALEAEAILVSKRGERRLPLNRCFKGPKETFFHSSEILTYMEFAIPEEPQNCFYLSLGQRKALAIHKLSVACQMVFNENGTVQKACVAYGAVAPTVLRGKKVERYLKGKKLTSVVLAHSAGLAELEVSPIDDIRSTAEYRRRMTGVLLRRGLESLINKNAK